MNAEAVLAALSALLNTSVPAQIPKHLSSAHAVACCRVDLTDRSIFLKYGPATELLRLQAEAAGLEELRSTQTVRVPQVLGIGQAGDIALLVLEWLNLRSPTDASDAMLGEQLARLHGTTRSKFGWSRNNFIGATPQPNVWSDDWLHFWRTHRLGVQLDLAERRGANAKFIERATLLSALMDTFFTASRPLASLLHGDLWSGNRAANEHTQPVIFDPAVYYGDRCADLAMTRLFGGFGTEFYAAYQAASPLNEPELARMDLYNLYHVLNHYNIFGGRYLSQATALVEKLLGDLGH